MSQPGTATGSPGDYWTTLALVPDLFKLSSDLLFTSLQPGRKLEARYRELGILRTAIDAYKEAADTGHIKLEIGDSGYPPNLQVLVDGVEDIQSEKKVMMYFLRRVPRDPMFPDATVSASDTWGLRSYKSPPTDPQPGDDVFDVYTLAQGKGLNGIAYREW